MTLSPMARLRAATATAVQHLLREIACPLDLEPTPTWARRIFSPHHGAALGQLAHDRQVVLGPADSFLRDAVQRSGPQHLVVGRAATSLAIVW